MSELQQGQAPALEKLKPASQSNPPTLTGILATATALIVGLSGFTDQMRILTGKLGLPASISQIALFLPLVLILTYWIRSRSRQVSRLKSTELLDQLGSDQGLGLRGRQSDLKKLEKLSSEYNFVFLIGESGVGKSALLQMGLLPKAKASGFLVVYLENLGEDWIDSPKEAMKRTLISIFRSTSPENPNALNGLEWTTMLDQVTSLVKGTPLIIFDDFDEYLVRHKDKLVSPSKGTWITPNELVEQNEFWAAVKALLKEGKIAVIFGAQSGRNAALHSFELLRPEIYPLDRLAPGVLTELLNELEEKGLIAEPENGWRDLRREIESDLRQEGMILPVQMKFVLQALDALPELTVHQYNQINRIRGIEAAHIDRIIKGVAVHSGLTAVEVLQLLAFLAQGADTTTQRKSAPKTKEQLLERLRNCPEKSTSDDDCISGLNACLEYLEQKQIIRQPVSTCEKGTAFLLYHDYLSGGILEVEQRANKWLIKLHEYCQAFKAQKKHFLGAWRALLSPITLGWFCLLRLRGKVQFQDCRSYVLLSCLRVVPYIGLTAAIVLAADAGVDFPGAESLRGTMDNLNISIFRRIPGAQDAIKDGHQLRMLALSEILSRHGEKGFISTTNDANAPENYWEEAQAIYALMHAPESSSKEYAGDLQRLLSHAEHIGPFGWRDTSEINHEIVRIEPLAWIGSDMAYASALSNVRADKTTDQLLRSNLDYLQRAIGYYHPKAGGWNLFPKQIDESRHSVYATALITQMLLDFRDYNPALWKGGEEELNRQIHENLHWLIQTFESDAAPPGWGDGDHTKPVEALTLQVYSVLLRADPDGHVLPAPIMENMRSLISTDLDSRIKDTNILLKEESIRQHPDYQLPNKPRVNMDQPETFVWYPWAVEFYSRWLEHEYHLKRDMNSRENRRARYALGILLCRKGTFYLKSNHKYTFEYAEALYALSTADQVLHKIEHL